MDSKTIYIKKEPIDLIPLGTFKAQVSFPFSGFDPELKDLLLTIRTIKVELADVCNQVNLLDGVLTRCKKCDCPIQTLMENGCQCGGI